MLLVRAVVASAVALLASAKVTTMEEFFESEVKAAMLGRDGTIDLSVFEAVDWESLFQGLMDQGAITDKEKPIDLDRLMLNGTVSKPVRRRLQSWDRQSALDTHNDGRTDTAKGQAEDKNRGYWPQASNLNRLLWDDELARVAQNYANTCVWGHNGNRNSQFNEDNASFKTSYGNLYIGENIAWGYRSPYSAIWDGWYSEHKDGYYTTGSSCSGCGVIGHYTQMVWADTRYIGCGLADCGGSDYLVCNYYPPGNYGNQYCYERGSPCSNCDADRNANDCGDKQCGGCPNPDYASCSDYYSNCADLKRYCPASCTDQSTDNLCTGCKNTCETGNCPVDEVYRGSCSYTV